MNELVWSLTQEMFSSNDITPGKTRTSDLVWWWRERVVDLGLDVVPAERQRPAPGRDGRRSRQRSGHRARRRAPLRRRHHGRAAQHRHAAQRLRAAAGRDRRAGGLRRALANANALQDIVMEEIRPGRTGNEILAASLARMKEKGINGTVYSHPIGLHGHGAGPLIGLWDYQDGVPGRGDAKVIPSMWYSIELQATTPVPEWGGQPVRMAQEEDAIIGADGKIRWAHRRQDRLFLVVEHVIHVLQIGDLDQVAVEVPAEEQPVAARRLLGRADDLDAPAHEVVVPPVDVRHVQADVREAEAVPLHGIAASFGSK
jgi:hypothetical protein